MSRFSNRINVKSILQTTIWQKLRALHEFEIFNFCYERKLLQKYISIPFLCKYINRINLNIFSIFENIEMKISLPNNIPNEKGKDE